MINKEFEIMAKKLDIISRLLAFNIIKDKPINEQIDILTKAGLKVSDIASILNKTENQVYVTKTNLKKKRQTEIKIVSNSRKKEVKTIE